MLQYMLLDNSPDRINSQSQLLPSATKGGKGDHVSKFNVNNTLRTIKHVRKCKGRPPLLLGITPTHLCRRAVGQNMHVLARFQSACKTSSIALTFEQFMYQYLSTPAQEGTFCTTLLCSHLDRISNRSATKVERAKAKMHRNGSAFALHRCTLQCF